MNSVIHAATVLQIIPRLDTGGAELATVEITEAVVRAGGRVFVFSEGGRMAGDIERAGGKLVAFPAATKNPARIIVNAFRIARFIRECGVDVVLDPVGGDVFDAAIRALAFAGRIVAIGFASGRIPEAKAGYFNVKNLTMAGMALDLHFRFAPELIREAVADVFDMCLSGRIRPEITATYALEEFHSAMGLFAARKSIGKMVLTTGRDG